MIDEYAGRLIDGVLAAVYWVARTGKGPVVRVASAVRALLARVAEAIRAGIIEPGRAAWDRLAGALAAMLPGFLLAPLRRIWDRLLAPPLWVWSRLVATVRWIRRSPNACRTAAAEYRSRTPDGAVLMHLLMLVLVLAMAVLFGRSTGLASVPLLALIVLTAAGWIGYEGETAKALTLLAAALTVTVMLLIVSYLVLHARDAFEHMGLELLWMLEGSFWEPPDPEGNYSLTPLLVGTALTTLIATLVAAPMGIAGAVFLSELAPERVRVVVKPGVELLAGIPSITYGFVGLMLVNQYFYAQFRTPTIASYFAVGLMIGLMALPTVVSVAEDALSAVPESMKSGSLAMGSTEWQTTKSVTIPAAFSGVSAAVMLGVGRAMGETMAATVMLSHSKGIPDPFFDVFSRYGETLTTVIASEAPNATGGMHESALFAAGVVLFVSVMTLSVGAQYVEWRMHRKLGGES